MNELRPLKITEYTGQEAIKKQIQIAIKGALKRDEPLDHILFYGGPGLGKTTLATIVANAMGSKIVYTNGPALGRKAEIVSILLNLKEGEILFVDEIHRLPKSLEETIYPALEDFSLDILIGREIESKTITFDLPKFTFIGATTRTGLITKPLLDRFRFKFNFDLYTIAELKEIINRNKIILGIELTNSAIEVIAKVSRGTPRLANHHLKFIRDYLSGEVGTKERIIRALEIQEVGLNGLTKIDRKILKVLAEAEGPVGLSTLSQITGEEEDTIESMVEPYLVQQGYINKTKHGRVATKKARGSLNG